MGEDDYKEVIIDTEEIADFFYNELLKRGHIPTEEILEDLADITFEFFIHKGIVDEEETE